MKTLIKNLIRIALVAMPLASQAATWKPFDILGGNQSVCLSEAQNAAATTFSYNTTNAVVTNSAGLSVIPGTVTNAALTFTNGAGGTFIGNADYTNFNAYTNVGTRVYKQAWVDVPFVSDANGNTLTSAALSVYLNVHPLTSAIATAGTNVFVFKFARVYQTLLPQAFSQWVVYTNAGGGTAYSNYVSTAYPNPVYTNIVSTAPADTWSLTLSATNLNISVCTNIPANFNQGAWGMRLVSVSFASTNSTSTTNYFDLQGLALNQFVP